MTTATKERATERTIKCGTLYRSFELDRAAVSKDDRTVTLAFSSETPVERWFGTEILDHSQGAVRLGRLKGGGPVLVDHRATDHVGVVEKVEISSDRTGRAVVRFGKGARADEIFNDVMDGIRRHVSVGYVIHRMDVKDPESEHPEYRATDWEPHEISLVAIPADPSVGVNRADDKDAHEIIIRGLPERKETTMTTETQTPTVDIVAERSKAAGDAVAAERTRVADIEKMAASFKDVPSVGELARAAINSGTPVEQFQRQMIDELAKKKPVPTADLGLSRKEIKQYSFLRLMRAQAFPQERRFHEEAAYERELSEAAVTASGKDHKAVRGYMVPQDMLRAPLLGMEGTSGEQMVRQLLARLMTRDLTAGSPTAGGYTVSTDLLAASFIDLLRNRMVVQRAGATVLNGLVGNIAIPRQSGGATAYWVAESGAPTEGAQTIDQVTMSPKTVGAFTDYSRKLLLQSSIDVEAFVRRDLAAIIGLEIDRVALYGLGSSNQPQGLKTLSGINTKDFGANAPTYAEIVAMETEVATDNADVGTLAYVVNAAGRGSLKTTAKDAGSGMFVWEPGNTVNGYRAEVSNQVESNDYWFGNWADLMLGFWSGLDVLVDPYTGGTSGTVRVIALQDTDVAARHPESFCRGNNNL